ncbi:MAG TPA: hypothetical protein VG672_28225 [Bryobacteraceae bacterium]|jgi:hypothetical protein|nr:hypothetical protein [Bryobacteraceae bacterium]
MTQDTDSFLSRLVLLLPALTVLPLCAQAPHFQPAWPVSAMASPGTNPLQTIVVPRAFTDVEANDSNRLPFSADISGQTNRYQQVYAASEFAGTGPITIHRIAFRPTGVDGSGHGAGQAFTAIIPQIEIRLATTHAAPDALSTTFADNLGRDSKLVFSGSLTLSSANAGPTNGPKQFDVIIPLARPFHYNPANGNLLLDVKTLLGVPTTFLDAEFMTGDSVSRVSSGWSFTTSGSDAQVASIVDSYGLVTQFGFTPASPSNSACGATDVTEDTRVVRGPLRYIFPTQYSYSQSITVTNISEAPIRAPLYLVVQGLPPDVLLNGYHLVTRCFSPGGDFLLPIPTMPNFAPSASAASGMVFFTRKNPPNISYTTRVLSGLPKK